MSAKACSEWGGLFSVGDDLDDQDLLEADWTPAPPPGPPAPPGSTPAAPVRSPRDRPGTPDPNPRALRSIGTDLSSSRSVSASSLRAPLGGAALFRPETAPEVPRGESTGDDFDDWDVDLDELDECVRPNPTHTPPSKRLKPSHAGEPVPRATPTSRPPGSPLRSPRSDTITPGRNVHPNVHPVCRFSTPWTPAPSRPSPRGTAPRRMGSAFQAVSPAPSPARMPRPLQMPVMTNHLVQLVSASNKTPQRPRGDTTRAKTRRFPGPAGALPQQVTGRTLDDLVVKVPQTPAHGAVARLRGQVRGPAVSEDDEFAGGAWAAMKAETGLDERNAACFLNSYSAVMVLRKAALRQLPKNKVPNMALVMKSIMHTHADAKAVFGDPTGEIQGTIHRRLLEDRQDELKPGAVLLLKQVGVFSPSYRNHYLNVTPSNLLRIYPPDGTALSSSQRSQSSPGPGLPPCLPPGSAGAPVSQMELHFDDDMEEPGTPGPVQREDAPWGADDLDELLGELPAEPYTA